METWMISNRQPWVEAIVQGWITGKTRSIYVNLPPVGAIVYLHASKSLWSGWHGLWWVDKYHVDVPNLPRGGIVAVATVADIGWSEDLLRGQEKFWQADWGSCMDVRAILFEDVKPVGFIPCRGSLVPTRKLPPELVSILS